MNKKQLIETVAKDLEKSKAEAEKFVNAVLHGIKSGLSKGGSVQLIGFGSFVVKERKARKGRNPKTGEVIKIKATKTVGFKPGKTLKKEVE